MKRSKRQEALDISQVKRHSITEASRKISLESLARVTEPSVELRGLVDNLPGILMGKQFRDFVRELTARRATGQPVLVMYGGHVVKCGLAPLLVDLMERGYVSALATNGAGAIHDAEMTLYGRTSEDVLDGLQDGTFGMARETGDFFADTLRGAKKAGLGEAIGRRLTEENTPQVTNSILASAYRLGLSATVHVAIGTDIVHQHPAFPARELGETSYRDFRILCRVLSEMKNGGVAINLGSAVILPEVFLKALTVVRNLGFGARDLVTANFDMLQHYRPRVNVVERPTHGGGRGFNFTGHHEIMVPLLHAAIRSYAECGGEAS